MDDDLYDDYIKFQMLSETEQKAMFTRRIHRPLFLFLSVIATGFSVVLFPPADLVIPLLLSVPLSYLLTKAFAELYVKWMFKFTETFLSEDTQEAKSASRDIKRMMLSLVDDLKAPPTIAALGFFLAFSLFACGFIFSFRGL